ncbi:unnamed protein product [Caenorhabditis auriculariae]|uniref:Uncharacterized protein n=1 Tax=Caenorhabditis auriculariae TaxID=2777116 RepID=A0A8S1HDM7_9PELO|nr:unnamed protein product [Caenorhabditis auriculariae]
MNERFFGDPGPGRGIRPGRLLIRKTRKNPKKKTRNHEREIFRGSGPGPRDPSRKASDPEKPGKKSQEKKTRNHEREIFFGDPGPGRGIREILVSERIQKDEQQVQEGF